MRYTVFDIETKTTFEEAGTTSPEGLEISVVSVFTSWDNQMRSFTEDELSNMWPLLESADFLVGYNSDHFDIPLLNKYYKSRGDLNKIKSVDLMKLIKDSFGRRVKLDDIAEATLGKNKIAHGLQAIEWWKKGEIDKIKKYCEEDVKITDELFQYALQNKKFLLKDRDSSKIIEIPITLEIESSSPSQSLF